MRVRLLYGSQAGEIVEMPYMVAQRAIRSGTVEEIAVVVPVAVTVPELRAAAPIAEVSPRPTRRTRLTRGSF